MTGAPRSARHERRIHHIPAGPSWSRSRRHQGRAVTALRQKLITAKVGPQWRRHRGAATSGRCGGMHARSTTIKADPDNLDAGIAFTRDEVMPAIQQIDGCIGLSMLTDRETGRCIVTTSWADADAMLAAPGAAPPTRLRRPPGPRAPNTRGGEPAARPGNPPAGAGPAPRSPGPPPPPNHLNELLDAYRHNLMP